MPWLVIRANVRPCRHGRAASVRQIAKAPVLCDGDVHRWQPDLPDDLLTARDLGEELNLCGARFAGRYAPSQTLGKPPRM